MYTVLQWAVPQLLATSKETALNPAFLVTSGLLHRDPFPWLFSLSTGKSAQHNLVQSFHKKFDFTASTPELGQDAGAGTVHIGAVVVAGFVSDKCAVTTARAVGETFWGLYVEKKGVEGRVSVEMLDPAYESDMSNLTRSMEGK